MLKLCLLKQKMKILVYYNVLHNNFIVVFDNYSYNKQLGQIYKVNSILISIIDVNVNSKPLFRTFKKLKNYKYRFGTLLIKFGEKLQGKKKPKNVFIYKKVFPWWKL